MPIKSCSFKMLCPEVPNQSTDQSGRISEIFFAPPPTSFFFRSSIPCTDISTDDRILFLLDVVFPSFEQGLDENERKEWIRRNATEHESRWSEEKVNALIKRYGFYKSQQAKDEISELRKFKAQDKGSMERKSVTLVYPSVTDREEVVKYDITFKNEQHFESFCRDTHGKLVQRNEDKDTFHFLNYDEVINGGVYAVGGEFFRAIAIEKQYQLVDAKIFEHESGLAVLNEVGGRSHLHQNVVFEHDGEKREIDGIVLHQGGQHVPNSTAYIIEAQISHPMSKIDKLMDKVQLFQKYSPASSHFGTVTKVVPVLAGKHWSKEVLDACSSRKIWRVMPSGRGYQIIKSFHTLVMKIKK